MLNSRYAPIVALAVLGVVIIGVLGWFLAISPEFDKRDALDAETATIRANMDQVTMQSVMLEQFAAQLDEDTSVSEQIALNAPSEFDLPAMRERLWSAFNDTDIELVTYSQDGEVLLTPVAVEPSALVATQVATLFQTGPVGSPVATAATDATTDPAAGTDGATTTPVTDGWSPVVALPTGETSASGNVFMVPFTMQVTGSPAETDDFLTFLADPEQPLFLVYNVEQVSRPADSGTLPGVSDAADGDVMSTITGGIFVRNPSGTISDEPLDSPASVPGDSAFRKPPNAPAQPGA